MCGLVACRSVSSTPDVGRASAAIERLSHRGPDGAGVHVLGAMVLAHRRLSIIDVARGGQPLLSEDGRIALVCNGEIYNHQTLRTDLQKRHAFRSQTKRCAERSVGGTARLTLTNLKTPKETEIDA